MTDLPLTDSPTRLWDLKSNIVEFEWWEEDSLIHDLSIFGGENSDTSDHFIDEVRESFSNQPFVNEFLKIIDKEGMYWTNQRMDTKPVP